MELDILLLYYPHMAVIAFWADPHKIRVQGLASLRARYGVPSEQTYIIGLRMYP